MVTPNSASGAQHELNRLENDSRKCFGKNIQRATVMRASRGVLEDVVMSDLFVDRIAAVRRRFAAQIDSRIDGIEAAMLRVGDDDLDILAQAHRDAHHLCGVGATLGFVGTGKVARSIEQILLAAVKAGRALTEDEVPCVRAGISLLRSTASVELGSAH
jgi:hypothetical protein